MIILVSLVWGQFGTQRDKFKGVWDPRSSQVPPTMTRIIASKADNRSLVKKRIALHILHQRQARGLAPSLFRTVANEPRKVILLKLGL